MLEAPLIIITGLPASGKTQFARALAPRLALPLLCKDEIKEELFELVGIGDAHWSRRLSDASFAEMFLRAEAALRSGAGIILEGNFRASEHCGRVLALLAAIDDAGVVVHVGQVCCVCAQSERVRRLQQRAQSGARHPGHLDQAAVAAAGADGELPQPAQFLALPGWRLQYDSGGG